MIGRLRGPPNRGDVRDAGDLRRRNARHRRGFSAALGVVPPALSVQVRGGESRNHTRHP